MKKTFLAVLAFLAAAAVLPALDIYGDYTCNFSDGSTRSYWLFDCEYPSEYDMAVGIMVYKAMRDDGETLYSIYSDEYEEDYTPRNEVVRMLANTATNCAVALWYDSGALVRVSCLYRRVSGGAVSYIYNTYLINLGY